MEKERFWAWTLFERLLDFWKGTEPQGEYEAGIGFWQRMRGWLLGDWEEGASKKQRFWNVEQENFQEQRRDAENGETKNFWKEKITEAEDIQRKRVFIEEKRLFLEERQAESAAEERQTLFQSGEGQKKDLFWREGGQQELFQSGERQRELFWREEGQQVLFRSEDGQQVLFQSEKGQQGWLENTRKSSEERSEKSVDVEQRMLKAEDIAQEVKHSGKSAVFSAVFWETGKADTREDTGFRPMFLPAEPIQTEKEQRTIIPIRESAETKENSAAAKETEIIRETTAEAITVKTEPTIDIEKLMRQFAQRLWEEREGCGRRRYR